MRKQIEGVEEVEIAYLLDREYCGKGLATEAAEAIVKYGYAKHGLRRIVAVIHPQNVASIRVIEKIGMKYERDVLYGASRAKAPKIVRVDSTTAKTYAGVSEDGLFQFGHSKDHRPDLPQVKINMATLDPLGLTISTTVVAGNTADDPLYAQEITRVRATTGLRSLTYAGDCKMAAIETRAFIVAGDDYYLCPLSLKQLPAAEREGLIEEFFANRHPSVIVIDSETDRVIGVGFEIEARLQAEPRERFALMLCRG